MLLIFFYLQLLTVTPIGILEPTLLMLSIFILEKVVPPPSIPDGSLNHLMPRDLTEPFRL